MKGIMSLLAKANLIELSDEEKAEAGIENSASQESVQEIMQEAVPPVPAQPPPLPELPLSGDGLQENRSVEDIYVAACLPSSPYPAEKLLRLLEGLRTMDAATRKAAVLAMDAADDNWQIGDCIDDAERKITVLSSYKQQLVAQVQAAEQQSVAKIEAIRAELESTSTEVRKQISELEQLLEREVTKSAQQTTSIEAGVRAARETAGRESRRIDGEIERLREIPAQFKSDK